MKKIININLSGRVIPIEDSAYEHLQAYIESLRRYFANEESRDEIINDIESRIAELMSEKVRKGASSITDADLEEIISSMGRPEDFEAEEAAEKASNVRTGQTQQESSSSATGASTSYSEKKNRRGRLYRDTSDKFIGGVCSGIAAYLNVDPAIVRILFAIITFGGFGLGFVAYILLWIILPPKDLEGFSGKRLYRNPDDRIIGGVSGGLAAYFNAKTTTIRLIFAAPLVLSVFFGMLRGFHWGDGFDIFPNIVFGSLSGTFILAYVVLWMVLPEANSPYEKMEMRGEKVDVNRIRQNVKESAENMKDRMKGWSEDVKESAQNLGERAKEFANTRGKTFAREVGETARSGGRGLAHAIGVLFKVFFLFIAGTIAFGLFVAVIALIFGGVAWWPINNFLWTSATQQWYAWGTLIFFLFVPLVGFIIWVIRRIIRVKSKSNYLGWTFGFLWTIGWVVATLFAASISKDHRKLKFDDTPVTISQPSTGKMIVTVSEPELSYSGRFDWINNGEGWDLSEDTMRLSNVDFVFRQSVDSAYHVNVLRFSFGSNNEDAISRARKIQYEVRSTDSVLDLANGYAIDKESKFRWQHVVVEIQVPVGKKVRFDRSVNSKLNQGDFDFGRNDEWDSRFGRNVYYSRYLRSDVDYTMLSDGHLHDEVGKPVQEEYRYPETDSQRLNRAIELKKLEIKELEDRKKLQEKRISVAKPESMDDVKEELELAVGSPSPFTSVASIIN